MNFQISMEKNFARSIRKLLALRNLELELSLKLAYTKVKFESFDSNIPSYDLSLNCLGFKKSEKSKLNDSLKKFLSECILKQMLTNVILHILVITYNPENEFDYLGCRGSRKNEKRKPRKRKYNKQRKNSLNVL